MGRTSGNFNDMSIKRCVICIYNGLIHHQQQKNAAEEEEEEREA